MLKIITKLHHLIYSYRNSDMYIIIVLCTVIADLQAKNRSLEEKNKMLEEKCKQFSEDGKQIQQHLSTVLKSHRALERRLSDATAEKEAYISVSVTIV